MSPRKAREQELENFKLVFCLPGMRISALAKSGPSSSSSFELFYGLARLPPVCRNRPPHDHDEKETAAVDPAAEEICAN
jgi:hypothetical protein